MPVGFRNLVVRGVGASGGGGGAPLLPTTGLLMGWEPRDATLSGSDIVSIPDLSGNGNTLSQQNPAGTPAAQSAVAAYNNQLVANCSGADAGQILRVAGISIPIPHTVYFVGESTLTVGSQSLVSGQTATRGQMRVQFIANSIQIQNGSSIAGGSLVANTPFAVCAVMTNSAGASGLYVNSWDDASVLATGAVGGDTQTDLAIGGQFSDGSERLIGRWAAMYIYDGAHSQADRVAVADYLIHYFAAPVIF